MEGVRRKHAIRLGRQSHVNAGKNSADIELTIWAMDLLAERSITGFCIVSSDGDFTPIVMRPREAGKLVIGFGEKKAPAGFVESCDRFETINGAKRAKTPAAKTASQPAAQPAERTKNETTTQKSPPASTSKGKKPVSAKVRKEFLDLVTRAAAGAKTNEGWLLTSVLGTRIRKIKPGIRYPDYGHKTLLGILKTYPDEVETKRENNGVDLIRAKHE